MLSIVIATMVAAISLFNYAFSLGIYLCILILHGLFVVHFGDQAVHMPLYTGAALFAVFIIRGFWTSINHKLLSRLILTLLFMTVASTLGSDVGNSLSTMFLYLKVFLLAILVSSYVKTYEDIRMLIISCMVGSAIGAVAIVFFPANTTLSGSMVRVAGLRGDPNDTAMLLIAGIPLAFWYFITNKSFAKKTIGVLFGIVLLYAVLLTGSRGGWVSIVLLAFIYALFRPSVIKFVSICLILTISLSLAPQRYVDRMATVIEGDKGSSRSISSRKQLALYAIHLFANNPFFGVGPGNYGNSIVASGRLSAEESAFTRRLDARVAHNMYLEFFAESGLLAGILFLNILYAATKGLMLLKSTSNTLRNDHSLGFLSMLSLLGMLFAGLFLSQAKNSVLWFFVGLGFSAYNVIQTEGKQVDNLQIASTVNQ